MSKFVYLTDWIVISTLSYIVIGIVFFAIIFYNGVRMDLFNQPDIPLEDEERLVTYYGTQEVPFYEEHGEEVRYLSKRIKKFFLWYTIIFWILASIVLAFLVFKTS